MHLSHQDASDELFPNKLVHLTDMLYGLPREGYRGCDRRNEEEVLTIEDPLEIRAKLEVAPQILEKEE